MRVKKQKRHRRAVRFYAACIGFREPYKILCDGTFVHHLLVNQITAADTALVNILGAAVKLFTTRCAVEELKSVLGASYSESLDAARSLLTASFIDKKEGRYNPRMSPYIPKSKWRKGSQWITLIRKHAEVVADDEAVFPVFKKLCKRRPPIEAIKGKLNLVS